MSLVDKIRSDINAKANEAQLNPYANLCLSTHTSNLSIAANSNECTMPIINKIKYSSKPNLVNTKKRPTFSDNYWP